MDNSCDVYLLLDLKCFHSFLIHLLYSKKGYFVKSFGTGDKVKLPGTAIDKPNIYDFSCTYDEIYNDLLKKDKALYPLSIPKK